MPCYYDQGQEPLVHDVFSDSIPDYGSIERWAPRYPFTGSAFNQNGRKSSQGTTSSDDTVTSGGTVRDDRCRPSDETGTSGADGLSSLGETESRPSRQSEDEGGLNLLLAVSPNDDDGNEIATTDSESIKRAREDKKGILRDLVVRALTSIWTGEDREFFFTAYHSKGGSKEISIDIEGKIKGKADSRFGFGFPFDDMDISNPERQALQEDYVEPGGKDFECREALSLLCDTEGNEAPQVVLKSMMISQSLLLATLEVYMA